MAVETWMLDGWMVDRTIGGPMFRYLAFLPPIAIDDAPGSARFSGRVSHALVSLTAAAAGLRLDVWASVEGFWMKSRNRVPPTTRRGASKMLSRFRSGWQKMARCKSE